MFIWPHMLWSLLLVPLLVGWYVWLLRRKNQAVLRYASLNIVKEAMGPGQRLRRHIPPFLFLLALIALFVALARPTALLTLPSERQTVVLAIDVSGSMSATDVKPTRMRAAQDAAKVFVAEQPRSTRLGIVSFAGTAAVVQALTDNREDITAAIERLQVQRATAIGSGILMSLATLFPDAGINVMSAQEEQGSVRIGTVDSSTPQGKPFTPVEPGSASSNAIILLTDGQSTMGLDPIEAAKMAAARGVRVYTVGIGTTSGEIIHFEGWTMRVRLDEETLKRIADMTRAEYFNASTAAELTKVYQTLNTRLVLERKNTEITVFLAAIGVVFALASALLSLLWFNRIL